MSRRTRSSEGMPSQIWVTPTVHVLCGEGGRMCRDERSWRNTKMCPQCYPATQGMVGNTRKVALIKVHMIYHCTESFDTRNMILFLLHLCKVCFHKDITSWQASVYKNPSNTFPLTSVKPTIFLNFVLSQLIKHGNLTLWRQQRTFQCEFRQWKQHFSANTQ